MEKECSCNYFEKIKEPSDEIFKNLNIIATSEFDYSSSPENGESTAILKCPKCNSYYLLNINNSLDPNKDIISIKAYTPKTDENGLVKILKNWKGIITDIEMDECSEIYEDGRKFITNMRKERIKFKDENRN
jgi:hypothetical protein